VTAHVQTFASLDAVTNRLGLDPQTFRRSAFVIALVLIGVLRIHYCTLVSTHPDIMRHLATGVFILRDGLSVASQPLQTLRPEWQITWGALPYNYPAVTLYFFTLVAAISPTLFFGKIVLTAVEGVNAFLFWKITRSKWLALFYWVAPASLWYVSKDGQFEPLQNVFTFTAVLLLFRRQFVWSFGFLAVATQVKLTAMLLGPFFVWRAWRNQRLLASSIVFLLSFLPTAWACLSYPAISQIRMSFGGMKFNPFYWNPLRYDVFPGGVWSYLCTINTYFLLAAIVYLAAISQRWLQYLAAILFVVILKLSVLGQGWYLVLLPSFLTAVESRKQRMILMSLLLLVDPGTVGRIIRSVVVPQHYERPDMRVLEPIRADEARFDGVYVRLVPSREPPPPVTR
jgi:hypothetical protein